MEKGKGNAASKDEWHREWTGIPKGTWDKMSNEEKDQAFAKAKSGSASEPIDNTVIPLSTMSGREKMAAREVARSKWDHMRTSEQNAVLKKARTKSRKELTALDEIALSSLRHPVGIANP